MELKVSGDTGFVIEELSRQHAVDEQRELARSDGDGFGFSDAGCQEPVKAASAVEVLPTLIAQRRRMTAIRLAENGVLVLSRRPPEILLLGASVVQESEVVFAGRGSCRCRSRR
jgi:hypothetical protein